eukprot:SAG31_NODE_244_length_19246_cov_20.233823_18_plen_87_part_00
MPIIRQPGGGGSQSPVRWRLGGAASMAPLRLRTAQRSVRGRGLEGRGAEAGGWRRGMGDRGTGGAGALHEQLQDLSAVYDCCAIPA